jgi:hypothetical protein
MIFEILSPTNLAKKIGVFDSKQSKILKKMVITLFLRKTLIFSPKIVIIKSAPGVEEGSGGAAREGEVGSGGGERGRAAAGEDVGHRQDHRKVGPEQGALPPEDPGKGDPGANVKILQIFSPKNLTPELGVVILIFTFSSKVFLDFHPKSYVLKTGLSIPRPSKIYQNFGIWYESIPSGDAVVLSSFIRSDNTNR